MREAEWYELVSHIESLWPDRSLPDRTVEAWYPLLADLPTDAVRRAVDRYAVEAEYGYRPPNPGDLRDYAEEATAGWETALATLRQHLSAAGGAYAEPQARRRSTGDQVLDVVIRRFGWRLICTLDLTDEAARAQFRDSYHRVERELRRARRYTVADSAAAGEIPAGGQPALDAGPGIMPSGAEDDPVDATPARDQRTAGGALAAIGERLTGDEAATVDEETGERLASQETADYHKRKIRAILGLPQRDSRPLDDSPPPPHPEPHPDDPWFGCDGCGRTFRLTEREVTGGRLHRVGECPGCAAVWSLVDDREPLKHEGDRPSVPRA